MMKIITAGDRCSLPLVHAVSDRALGRWLVYRIDDLAPGHLKF